MKQLIARLADSTFYLFYSAGASARMLVKYLLTGK